MIELIRDTAFGQLVRAITKNRYFQYPDEKDLSIWKKWVNEEKSGWAARHGTIEKPPKEVEDSEGSPDDLDRDRLQNRPGWETNTPRSQASDNTAVEEGRDVQYNSTSGRKIDPEKGRDLTLIEFLPDDPENPLNWTRAKKFFVTFEICLLTIGVYIGSAIYSSGETSVEEDFGVSEVVATLGLSLFVAGYGTGPMIWSPMSEVPQIGRNKIYIGTLLVFVLLQVPTALSVNIGMLLAFRFLSGFFGSPVLATGGATLSDIYNPAQRAYAISIWGIAAVCGPVLGPLVGGWAAMFEGWRWTIWELIWISGFALIFLFFFLPETSANNILYRRTARLRKLTGNDKLICQPELMGEGMTGKDIVLMVLVRPITLNFTEPIVFLLNLYIALIYALLYCWFESFPLVFVDTYGFNLGEEGLAYLGILVGALLVISPYFYYLKTVQVPQFNENGEIQPEKRLPPACVGGFCITICMFWFAWTSRSSVLWIVPIIGSAFFSIGAFLLFNSVLSYLGDAYPEYVASVYAGNDLFRSSFGAGFPLFATAMYDKLGIDWATSLLGFLSVAFIPIPFLLYYYGETIRVKYSKRARKDF